MGTGRRARRGLWSITCEGHETAFDAPQPGGVDYSMAQAYAGCLVAQRCVEAAGCLDNSKLRQAAERLDFTTFYGRFKIDPSTGRQVGHSMVVVRWRGDKKVVVWLRGRI